MFLIFCRKKKKEGKGRKGKEREEKKEGRREGGKEESLTYHDA